MQKFVQQKHCGIETTQIYTRKRKRSWKLQAVPQPAAWKLQSERFDRRQYLVTYAFDHDTEVFT